MNVQILGLDMRDTKLSMRGFEKGKEALLLPKNLLTKFKRTCSALVNLSLHALKLLTCRLVRAQIYFVLG